MRGWMSRSLPEHSSCGWKVGIQYLCSCVLVWTVLHWEFGLCNTVSCEEVIFFCNVPVGVIYTPGLPAGAPIPQSTCSENPTRPFSGDSDHGCHRTGGKAVRGENSLTKTSTFDLLYNVRERILLHVWMSICKPPGWCVHTALLSNSTKFKLDFPPIITPARFYTEEYR